MIISLSELNVIFILKDGISLQVRKGGPWERRRCGAKHCKRHKHIINVFVFASIKSLLPFQAPNLNFVIEIENCFIFGVLKLFFIMNQLFSKDLCFSIQDLQENK